MDDFDDFGQEEIIDDTLILEEQTITEPPVDTDELDNIQEETVSDSDIISELLRSSGIVGKNDTILYETEEGEQVEKSWNLLSKEDKLGILNSIKTTVPSDDLDDSEVELINTIRTAKMSPAEYIQYIEKSGVDRYLQNSSSSTMHYKVDDYNDDDLFMYDMIAKLGDTVTDEEVQEALDRAKSNKTLFAKQVEAIRNEYIRAEQAQIDQYNYEQQAAALEQYNQFSQSIVNQINSFNNYLGCDIEMDKDEKQELYEFITGFDDAGNNHFAKVLNDPDLVVKMAWTLLNGEKLIEDLNEYYKSKISDVRKNSYEKGLQDAKQKSNLIIKTNNNKNDRQYIDDDEF